MPELVDLFIIGAIVHFCLLGLHLVRYIERDQVAPSSNPVYRWYDRILGKRNEGDEDR
jgi:hypothetical protein